MNANTCTNKDTGTVLGCTVDLGGEKKLDGDYKNVQLFKLNIKDMGFFRKLVKCSVETNM